MLCAETMSPMERDGAEEGIPSYKRQKETLQDSVYLISREIGSKGLLRIVKDIVCLKDDFE